MMKKHWVALSAATLGLSLAASPSAWANVYTDVNMPPLTESPQAVGSYNFSTGTDGQVTFRWVSDPSHTTVLGYNTPGAGAPSTVTSIGAHNTNRFVIAGNVNQQTFTFWARVAVGAGSMSARTGNIGR